MKYLKEAYYLSPFVVISFLLVFTRPFVGLSILGFRIGELLVVFGFFVVIFSPIYYFFAQKKFNLSKFKNIQTVFTLILISFCISIVINNTAITNSYTYKISSYIWTAGYLFLVIYFFKDKNTIQKYNKIISIIFLFIPIAHYFLSTGFYPNVIIDFFKINSDKFEFTKASDIMLSFVVANLLNFKLNKNDTFKIYYLYLTGAMLLPLLLFMSRGSFLAGLLFIAIFSVYNFQYFVTNFKKTLKILISSFLVFTFSTYNINGTEINYSFNLVANNASSDNTLSVTENIKEIAKKDKQRKAFLSLYFENGRIYSHDPTTDWRLDIWQDVYEDLSMKSLISKGYGYDEIIPVMLDPSAPGRLGRDGLNEHVHNYFVNIFARGGLFQFLLYVAFYGVIIMYWKDKYKNFSILIFLMPILLNSTLDMSMEGVQYPVVFFLFLGFLLNNGLEIKLNKINNK